MFMAVIHEDIDRGRVEKTVSGARTAIELTGIAKEYRAPSGAAFCAVTDIDLEVAEGEFVALVGPSGCGKTTLLRMISALEASSAGSITIHGEPPERLTRTHRLGIAFQEHALLPWLTVQANLELPFHIAGRPVDHPKIAMLLELVRLADFAGARPKQLSGGMRQRVAIARALTLDPEVLLLDEPFGALDAVTRRHMNIELERIWRQSRTTAVLVTHSVAEALFLADRVVIMGARPGRIVRVVTPGFPRQGRIDIMRSEGFHQLTDELITAIDPDGSAA
jgi:NitT/TauT family transport system ATP-binding protein